jgi:hypothetical protein
MRLDQDPKSFVLDGPSGEWALTNSSPARNWRALEQTNLTLVAQIRGVLANSGVSIEQTVSLAERLNESPVDMARLLSLPHKVQMLPSLLEATRGLPITSPQAAAYYQLAGEIVDTTANFYLTQAAKRNATLQESLNQRPSPTTPGMESSFGFVPMRGVFGDVRALTSISRQIGEEASFPINVSAPSGIDLLGARLAENARNFSFTEKVDAFSEGLNNLYNTALYPGRLAHQFISNQINRVLPPKDPMVRGYYTPAELYQIVRDLREDANNPTLFDKLYQGFGRVMQAADKAQRAAIPWLAWVFGSLAAGGQLEARVIRYQPGQPLPPADQAFVQDVFLRTLTAPTETADILVLQSKDSARALNAVFMLSREETDAQLRSSVDWGKLAAQFQGQPEPAGSKPTASPPYLVVTAPGAIPGSSGGAVLATNTHYLPKFFPFGLPSLISVKYDVGLNTGTTSANIHMGGGVVFQTTPSVRTNPVAVYVEPDGRVTLRNLLLGQLPGSLILYHGTYFGPFGFFTERSLGTVVPIAGGRTANLAGGSPKPAGFDFYSPNAKNVAVPAAVINPKFVPEDFMNLRQSLFGNPSPQPTTGKPAKSP